MGRIHGVAGALSATIRFPPTSRYAKMIPMARHPLIVDDALPMRRSIELASGARTVTGLPRPPRQRRTGSRLVAIAPIWCFSTLDCRAWTAYRAIATSSATWRTCP